jgi:hypothetical protein
MRQTYNNNNNDIDFKFWLFWIYKHYCIVSYASQAQAHT